MSWRDAAVAVDPNSWRADAVPVFNDEKLARVKQKALEAQGTAEEEINATDPLGAALEGLLRGGQETTVGDPGDIAGKTAEVADAAQKVSDEGVSAIPGVVGRAAREALPGMAKSAMGPSFSMLSNLIQTPASWRSNPELYGEAKQAQGEKLSEASSKSPGASLVGELVGGAGGMGLMAGAPLGDRVPSVPNKAEIAKTLAKDMLEHKIGKEAVETLSRMKEQPGTAKAFEAQLAAIPGGNDLEGALSAAEMEAANAPFSTSKTEGPATKWTTGPKFGPPGANTAPGFVPSSRYGTLQELLSGDMMAGEAPPSGLDIAPRPARGMSASPDNPAPSIPMGGPKLKRKPVARGGDVPLPVEAVDVPEAPDPQMELQALPEGQGGIPDAPVDPLEGVQKALGGGPLTPSSEGARAVLAGKGQQMSKNYFVEKAPSPKKNGIANLLKKYGVDIREVPDIGYLRSTLRNIAHEEGISLESLKGKNLDDLQEVKSWVAAKKSKKSYLPPQSPGGYLDMIREQMKEPPVSEGKTSWEMMGEKSPLDEKAANAERDMLARHDKEASIGKDRAAVLQQIAEENGLDLNTMGSADAFTEELPMHGSAKSMKTAAQRQGAKAKAFEAMLNSNRIRTWRDVREILPKIADAFGVEEVRLPAHIEQMLLDQDAERQMLHEGIPGEGEAVSNIDYTKDIPF